MSVIIHSHNEKSTHTVFNNTTTLYYDLIQYMTIYNNNNNQYIIDISYSTNELNEIISRIYNLPNKLINKFNYNNKYNNITNTNNNYKQYYNIELYNNNNIIYICIYINTNTKLYNNQYKYNNNINNKTNEYIDFDSDITNNNNINININNDNNDDITYNNAIYQCIYILDQSVIIQSIHKLNNILHNTLNNIYNDQQIQQQYYTITNTSKQQQQQQQQQQQHTILYNNNNNNNDITILSTVYDSDNNNNTTIKQHNNNNNIDNIINNNNDITYNELYCISLYDIFDILYINDNIQYKTYNNEAKRISELNNVLSIDEYTDLLNRIQLLRSNIISLLQHIKYIIHIINTLHNIYNNNNNNVVIQSYINTEGQYIDINTIYIEYNILYDQIQSLYNFVDLYLNDYRTRVLSYYSTKNQHISIHIKHLAMLFFIFNTLNTIADLGGTNINIPYQHNGINNIIQLIPFFTLCSIMFIWIIVMYIMFKRYKIL